MCIIKNGYIFYWRIVALHCCVSFYCTAKWISHMYTYIPSFWISFPFRSPQSWVEFPMVYSRFSLVIYFIHSISDVYMSIPISQLIPPIFPYVCALYLFVCFCFANNIIESLLIRKYIHMYFIKHGCTFLSGFKINLA